MFVCEEDRYQWIKIETADGETEMWDCLCVCVSLEWIYGFLWSSESCWCRWSSVIGLWRILRGTICMCE